MIRQGVATAVLALGATGAFAATLASSSFDTGKEGWIIQGGATSYQWQAAGGQSGAFVQAADGGADRVWFYSAPDAYLGDQSAAVGGSLSFYLRALPEGNAFEENYADVKLVGTRMTLAIDAGASPGADWTGYDLPLVANGQWRVETLDGPAATTADLQAVLGSLSAIRIRGEFSNVRDVGGLDSVMLSSAAPVPETGSALLMAAGLGALVVLRRRRRG